MWWRARWVNFLSIIIRNQSVDFPGIENRLGFPGDILMASTGLEYFENSSISIIPKLRIEASSKKFCFRYVLALKSFLTFRCWFHSKSQFPFFAWKRYHDIQPRDLVFFSALVGSVSFQWSSSRSSLRGSLSALGFNFSHPFIACNFLRIRVCLRV